MSDEKKTPIALILAAWIFVCIPAGWGIYNTAVNALKLFAKTSPSQTNTAPSTQRSSASK